MPGVKSYLERIIQLGFEADYIWRSFKLYSNMSFKRKGESDETLIVQLIRPLYAKSADEWLIAPGWHREDDGGFDCAALSIEEYIAFIDFINAVELWLQKGGDLNCLK